MTDGPYLELKEVVGGFVLLEAEDIDEAVAIAAEWPLSGATSIEVRPVIEPRRERRRGHLEPAGQQLALGRVGGQRQRPSGGRVGLLAAAERPQQLGPGGVQQPVLAELVGRGVHLGERRRGPCVAGSPPPG